MKRTKEFSLVLALAVAVIAPAVVHADVILSTGTWDGSTKYYLQEAKADPNAGSTPGSVMQALVIPGSYAGQTVTVESMSWALGRSAGGMAGFEVYIIPGTLPADDTSYVDNTGSAVGHFYLDSTPVPSDLTARTDTFDSSFTVTPGASYYVEIRIDATDPYTKSGMVGIAKAPGPYTDGAWATIDSSGNMSYEDKDVMLTLNGTITPEPATLGLLSVGGVLALCRRKRE